MVELRGGFWLQRSAELSDIHTPHLSPVLEENITYPFDILRTLTSHYCSLRYIPSNKIFHEDARFCLRRHPQIQVLPELICVKDTRPHKFGCIDLIYFTHFAVMTCTPLQSPIFCESFICKGGDEKAWNRSPA